jgi:hypothetical protein
MISSAGATSPIRAFLSLGGLLALTSSGSNTLLSGMRAAHQGASQQCVMEVVSCNYAKQCIG